MPRWLKCLLAKLILWAVKSCTAGPSAEDDTDSFSLIAGTAPRRSGRWPAVRAAHLLAHPTCSLCGHDRDLEVHHIEPYHLAPDQELDPANLITLCEESPLLPGLNCHLFAGHLGRWASINPRVRKFVLRVRWIFDGEKRSSDG